MHATIIDLFGWLPAIIIPLATIVQLGAILRHRSTAGVSALTWLLFGVANIGLYIYTEKYGDIQAIAGLLGSAVLDFLIAGLALMGYGSPDSDNLTVSDPTAETIHSADSLS